VAGGFVLVGEDGEVRVITEFAAPSSACRHLLPVGAKGRVAGRSRRPLPFSPMGRRWPEGSDEGATRAESFKYSPAKVTPLCPAGHLPHKGGDRLGLPGRSTLIVWPKPHHLPISPLVGEMSGRTEGGIAPTEPAAPSSGCRHLLPAGEKRLGVGSSLHLPLPLKGTAPEKVTISRPAKTPRAAA